ncbi:MAG TPA: ABC transporter permease [Bryobacteraceae bacterium]|nr:ABC transporter permease [Bryobacteraceae bacterium]
MFLRRKRSFTDFQEEIRSHLEAEADQLREEGLGPDEAVYAARRAFGNLASIEERSYERTRLLWWDHLRQDARYALRTLSRSPLFSLAAVITLALGIGANTAIFSVVRAVLLKPLPYATPERIMVLEPMFKNTGQTGKLVSAPDFHDWQAQSRSFASMAYHTGGNVTVIANGAAAFADAQAVTPDFFTVFGLPPEAGRFWSRSEDRSPLAVVSHAWAARQFGSVLSALRKTIRVYGQTVEVIGVTAPGFRYPGESDIWIPAGLFPETMHRSAHNYYAVGRLKAGVSLADAQREMRGIGDRLEREYAENRFKTVSVTPLSHSLTQGAEKTLWILLGAVAGVLLIACANVANLQLARAASRSREMAVRAALGAGRGRILRQVLTEAMVLGGLGAAAGLALAALLLRALLAIAPAGIPRLDEVRIDGGVLLFSLALAVVCSILSGLGPARRASAPDLDANLRQNGTRGSVGRVSGRVRAALVIAEVALSLVLLSAAGLLLRSFVALTRVDLGFSTNRLLLTRTSIPVDREEDERRATEFHRDLIERIAAQPGVRRAAGVRTTPFSENRSDGGYWIEGGRTYRPGEQPNAQMQVVTPGYFDILGVPILRGRDFNRGDAWGRPQVAMINERLAREAFGRDNPLGRRIRCGLSMQSLEGMEIVGVVKDARQIAPGQPAAPEIYMPYLQHPLPASNLTLVVETRLEPHALAATIRRTARSLNPDVPVRFSTMDEVVRDALAYPRFRAVLIGCFALLAAALASLGIYSVISYLVGQRTGEIGLRLALGARPADVFRFVIGGSLRLVACGLALGLAGTLALSRVLETLLFGVEPQDPLTLASVLAALGLAALAGSSIPALRAARLDPLAALRQE